MTTIYTIGRSRHPAERFVGLLRAQTLANHAIEYLFLGRELGGRPDGAEFYRSDGGVDYDRRAQAPDFKAGAAGVTVLHVRGDGRLESEDAATPPSPQLGLFR